MLYCREHGEPSKDQRSGAKNGACWRCRPPVRKHPHSEPRKPAKDVPVPWYERI